MLLETFNHATFDMLKTVVPLGMRLLPFAMLIFGDLGWLRRRRERLQVHQSPLLIKRSKVVNLRCTLNIDDASQKLS
jgi:hypothetical protein